MMKVTSNERWTYWVPTADPLSTYYFKHLQQNKDSLTLLLEGKQAENKRVLVTISKEHLYSFKLTEESYGYRRFDELLATYGKEFYFGSRFFKVENSNYIRWLAHRAKQDAATLLSKLSHFVIIVYCDEAHFVTSKEPTVEVFEEKGV